LALSENAFVPIEEQFLFPICDRITDGIYQEEAESADLLAIGSHQQ